MPNENSSILQVHARSRNRTHYNGPALVITSRNEYGPFDILPQHANFITVVVKYIKIKKPNNEWETLKIEKGVLKVVENTVDIYLEITSS